MNKKLKRILAVLLATVLISAFVSDLISANPQLKFYVNDYLTANERKVKLTEIAIDASVIQLSELLRRENADFNQSLMLINKDNHLSDDFSPDIQNYKDTDVKMNKCVVSAYETLSKAVLEKFGQKLLISSAYRTDEEQAVLEKENEYATEVGASEHCAGLSLDVYVKYYAGKGFLKTESGVFVNENCWEYGFIVRYPYYGEKTTGIEFEPWHLRYVGFPHAEIIYKNRLTLEEYISSLEYGKFYKYGEYIVTRQTGDTPKIPTDFDFVTVSHDNQNGYIYTFKNVKQLT